MKLGKWISIATATATAFGLLAGCGANSPLNSENLGNMVGGETGQYIKAGGHLANAAAMSEKDEDSMGQAVGASLTSNYGVYDNQQALTYVTLVGLTVASATPNPGGNYVFGILNTSDVNAFSGPNGYIFITKGCLDQMKDEAELAGVLGHEMAHCIHHDGLHQAQATEEEAAATTALGAQSQLSQFSQMTNSGIDAICKTGYTQPQEFAADEDGVKFMTAAGYDPHSYLNFLKRLAALQGTAAGGSVMSTHPAIGERVTRVSTEIEEMNNPTGATLAARFAKYVTPAANPLGTP
jgi:beta-barrel assembly-enhancing protease